MQATDFQNCDDFSTAIHAPTPLQSAALQIAKALNFGLTFQFNRAMQGATHYLAGRDNAYSDDPFYDAGYKAAAADHAALRAHESKWGH